MNKQDDSFILFDLVKPPKKPEPKFALTEDEKAFRGECIANRAEKELNYVKPYIPNSWFHEMGAIKKRSEILPKLPNLRGALFITFTVDPKFFADEASAFKTCRNKLRKVFYALRKGVEHNGEMFAIDAPYLTKVEFHKNGYAHLHVVFRTRRFLPPKLVDRLWGLGRVNVKRIRSEGLKYLLKYVTKSGEIPDWVKAMTSLRIVQPSSGFYMAGESLKPLKKVVEGATPEEVEELAANAEEEEADSDDESAKEESQTKQKLTIGERIEKWASMALLHFDGKFRTILLQKPFAETFGAIIFEVAQNNQYLGNWVVRIDDVSDLLMWDIMSL